MSNELKCNNVSDSDDFFRCSKCGCEIMFTVNGWKPLYMGEVNYCPNCGAKVSDEEDREEYTDTELKPCPLCGNEPKIWFDEHDTWTIECNHHEWTNTDEKGIRVAADIAVYSDVEGKYDFDKKKQVYTPDEIERARKKAIDEWNNRV